MVRYVILRRFLRDIPPKISLRNTYISVWITPRRGHLQGVNISDASSWIPFPNCIQSIDDAHHTAPVSDDYVPDFGLDDESYWPDDDNDDKNNEASHDAQNFSRISNTNHNPPNTMLDTSKRVSQVPVIPARINALSSAKTSMAWEAGMKTSWKKSYR